MRINDIQKAVLTEKVKTFFKNQLQDKQLAVWGLAFKPETDDIREAPALTIIEGLLETGVNISVYDPEAMENVKDVFGDRISYSEDQYETLIGADALLIITEWSAFRTPSFRAMKELMRTPVIFDGRNLYEPGHLSNLGFHYESIGRPIINALDNGGEST